MIVLQIYTLESFHSILRGYSVVSFPGQCYLQIYSCKVFCLHFGEEISDVGILPFTVVIHGLALQSMFVSDHIYYVILLSEILNHSAGLHF